METQAALRLVDHIFSQPSLAKFLDNSDQHGDNMTTRVIKAMEVITNFGEAFSSKESRLRDLEREVRKLESLLAISEKERVMSQQ